jgi:hypothetical protein
VTRRFSPIRIACLAVATVLVAATASAQGTVRIIVPAALSVEVTNVLASSLASPNPSQVSFDNALGLTLQAVRISVKADSDLAGPNGSSIPASNVSWTTSNVSNGVGVNGTLSKTSYAVVFDGQPLTTTGHVDIVWTLSMPGASIRAGTHQATLRWKVEAFTP